MSITRALSIGLILTAILAAGAAQPASAAAPATYIVVLERGADRDAATAFARAAGAEVLHEYAAALNGYAARLPARAAEALRRNPNVLFVGPDIDVRATARGTQALPAGVDRVNADRGSARAGDGRGSVDVNVAVLDTGIDLTHPDLNVVGGVNCTNEKSFADGNGHGTHVAGTVAALDNDLGVVGVAPGARLWAVRVLNDKGSGKLSGLLCGLEFALASRLNADPADDIAVVNMSLSGPGSDDGNCGLANKDAYHQAICRLSDAGVVIVASAGNGSRDFAASVPAAYGEVLTVTAMSDYDGVPGGVGAQTCLSELFSFPDDDVPFFSNFAGSLADQVHTIAAPGVCVLSTLPAGGYGLISGTSQSAPHVAGAAALCIAAGACMGSGKQIMEKIVSDAANFTSANGAYGFNGDPLRPLAGKYYGYLLHAGGY